MSSACNRQMTQTATDPEHIAISKSKGITIDWKDGHASTYGLDYLRENCPCATFHDRISGQSTSPPTMVVDQFWLP